MSDAPTIDPFTQAYEAIWAMYEDHAPFDELVPAGNRVKYSGDGNPSIKTTMRHGDTPEVRVVADSLDPRLFRTSNGSSINRVFRTEIYTNDLRLTAAVFPVEWAILQAYVKAEDTLVGLDFVKKVRPIPERAPGIDPTKRTKGWYSVLALDVEMWFRTAHIPQL